MRGRSHFHGQVARRPSLNIRNPPHKPVHRFSSAHTLRASIRASGRALLHPGLAPTVEPIIVSGCIRIESLANAHYLHGAIADMIDDMGSMMLWLCWGRLQMGKLHLVRGDYRR
jgi:hypothetical protein